MENIERLNSIYEKHKDSFSSNFHTALWRVFVDNIHKGKIVAFTSNYNHIGLQLGLAYANESGFMPLPTYFESGMQAGEEVYDILEDMNLIGFDLDENTSLSIVGSSMRGEDEL